MTVTHAGTLTVVRESFAMLAAAIEGLPDEALAWIPAPNTNSITVLTAHGVSATRFFLRCGSGEVGSMAGYRATERAEAFAARGTTAKALLTLIQDFVAEAETILRGGTEAHLGARVEWADVENPPPARTGAGSLFAAIGHLREHVGQAQLMRDLWLARESRA